MRTGTQFIIFSFIGVLNTVIHYVLFLLLFRLFGAPVMVSSALGYLVGMVNSFFLNRHWTFKISGTDMGPEFIRFIVVNLVSLGVNLLVLQMLVSQANIMPEIAQGVAILGALVVNFSGNKLWTFNR